VQVCLAPTHRDEPPTTDAIPELTPLEHLAPPDHVVAVVPSTTGREPREESGPGRFRLPSATDVQRDGQVLAGADPGKWSLLRM